MLMPSPNHGTQRLPIMMMMMNIICVSIIKTSFVIESDRCLHNIHSPIA